MVEWIVVAVAGGLAALAGLVNLLARYRRGDVTLTYLLAVIVGFSSLATYAALSAVRPDSLVSARVLAVLVPGIVAIVVLVREGGSKSP